MRREPEEVSLKIEIAKLLCRLSERLGDPFEWSD